MYGFRRLLAAASAAVLLLMPGVVGVPDAVAAEPGGGQAFDVTPARQALGRLVPRHEKQVTLRALPRASGQPDRFGVSGRDGHIVVEGTSPAVLLTGFGWYLSYVVHANVTFTGDQLRLPATLPAPDHPIRHDANVANRFALNDVDEGYTEPYADWDYWQHKIDVLALHGINEVLVYQGQAKVYQQTFADFGYTAEELRAWIPQPAHQPWWLLQNMCCFPTPVSQHTIDAQAALGRKIADRLRELGMTPVLPGYFGTVPDGFVDRNPGAHVVPQGPWGGFTRPDWLDPTNPWFARVAAEFYEKQSALFGDSTMYKMDLLHEGGRAGDVDVDAASKAVQHALEDAHPGAIWAILGWQSNPRPETIAAVDRSRMLILDGLSDRYGGLDREQTWDHTPYAFGSIWNFGGHTTIGANISVWNTRYHEWLGKSGSALAGIAMMPEASDNNPVAFDFLTELAWRGEPVDLDQWFADWAWRRYGGAHPDPHAVAAWQAMAHTAYAMPADGWTEAQDSLFNARPSLDATTAAQYSPRSMRYDPLAFAAALPELLRVAPSLRRSSAYRYDLTDVTRQVLANESRVMLPEIRSAYDAGDRAGFDRLTTRWLHLMRELDAVLGSDEHFMLGPWLARATAAAGGDTERARLAHDVKSLITVWGDAQSANGGLADYANRSWQGLVGDYYHARWKAYFDTLDTSLATGKPPVAIDWYAVGDAWARNRTPYPTRPRGDSHQLAAGVLSELTNSAQGGLTLTADPSVSRPGGRFTVTATFTNQNWFATADDVRLSLTVPDGYTVEPSGPITAGPVPPGTGVTGRWEVTAPENAGAKLTAKTLTADATWSAGTAAGATAARTTVYVGDLPPVDPDAVAAWDFTLGYPADVSAHGHDGATGPGVSYTDGGASFDGSDDGEITVPYAAGYQPKAAGDAETWSMRLTGVVPRDTGGDYRAIASARDSSALGWTVYIAPDGEFQFWLSQQDGGYAVASSGVVATPGARYDVTAEWNGTAIGITVSGAGDGSGTAEVGGGYRPPSGDAPLRFGNGGNSGTAYFFSGTVASADVRIGAGG